MIQTKLCELVCILRYFFHILFFFPLQEYPHPLHPPSNYSFFFLFSQLHPITFLSLSLPALLRSLVQRWGVFPQIPMIFSAVSLILPSQILSPFFSLLPSVPFLPSSLFLHLKYSLKARVSVSCVILIFSVLPIRLFQNDRKISLAC